MACDNEWVQGVCNKPRIKCLDCCHRQFSEVNDQGIYRHLIGKQVVGLYPLLHDNSLTLDIRFWGWRQTLEKISEHWILGYGLRTDLEVSWVGTPYEASPPDWFHPHNLFLEVWYQTGVIGLLLTLSMFGLIARKIHQLWYAVEIRYFSCILGFCPCYVPGGPTRPHRPPDPLAYSGPS